MDIEITQVMVTDFPFFWAFLWWLTDEIN